MNESYHPYTLGKIRSDVFRALDEYSRNGAAHEIYFGGTGDIDKRFVPALNAAIRLVFLAGSRSIKTSRVSLRLPIAALEKRGITLSGGKTAEIETGFEAGALCALYSGSGKVSFFDPENALLGSRALSSDCGVFCSLRTLLPEGTASVTFEAEKTSALSVKVLFVYDRNEACAYPSEEFLPDFEKLYCAFSPRCAEIVSVVREGRRGSAVPNPQDVFTAEGGLLSCACQYAGDYLVSYTEFPQEIAENALPDTEIPLTPVAYDAVVYAAAAELCRREDGELYTRLIYKYREILMNCCPSSSCRTENRFFSGRYSSARHRRKMLW